MVSGKVKCLDELMPKLFAAGSKVSEVAFRCNVRLFQAVSMIFDS